MWMRSWELRQKRDFSRCRRAGSRRTRAGWPAIAWPVRRSPSPERRVDRRRRLAEPARAIGRHVETVLQPDAELAGQVEAGFVGEAHAGGERRLFAAHEVDGLVAVQADAVPGAVRQARQLVVGAVAEAGVVTAHRVVDRPGRGADLRCLERDLLAAMDLVPHL